MNTMTNSTTEGFIAPPSFSRDLIRYLHQVFPDRLPIDIQISDRELGSMFGAQRVIRHLEGLLQQQEDEQLPNVFQTQRD